MRAEIPVILAIGVALFLLLGFVAWRRYLWAAVPSERADTCPYSLTDVFSKNDLRSDWGRQMLTRARIAFMAASLTADRAVYIR